MTMTSTPQAVEEPFDSRPGTQDHIDKVEMHMARAIGLLDFRARRHDASKLVEPELSGWNALGGRRRGPYGSQQYLDVLEQARPTVEAHYAANDHHPEHSPEGVSGMSALAIIEMVCDWKAASEKGPQQMTFLECLNFNEERFGYGSRIADIIYHTAKELGFV